MISGALAAVEKASALAKAKGARRAVMLPVSAPFHCALMQPAQEEVARVLAAVDAGRSPHSRGRQRHRRLVTTADEVRDALIRQVTGAVRWVDCMQTLIAAGPRASSKSGPARCSAACSSRSTRRKNR